MATTPSLSQAQRLKKLSRNGELTRELMDSILSEEKKPADKATLSGNRLKRYFPESYTPKQMEETIIRLLERWLAAYKKQIIEQIRKPLNQSRFRGFLIYLSASVTFFDCG